MVLFGISMLLYEPGVNCGDSSELHGKNLTSFNTVKLNESEKNTHKNSIKIKYIIYFH